MKKRVLFILILCLIFVATAGVLSACGGGSGDIVGLTVVEMPSKTEYVIGEDIDLTGLVVVGTKADGSSTNPLNITADMISFNNTQIGTTTVTIAYPVSARRFVYQTFTVKITEPKATKLEILTVPTKTAYVDGQTLDLSGLSVKLTYSDGSESVVDYTALTYAPSVIKLSDANDKGEVVVTLYKGARASSKFIVTVEEKSVVGLDVATPAKKTSYVEGEYFEIEGLTLMQKYNDGSYFIIPNEKLTFDEVPLVRDSEGGCAVAISCEFGTYDYRVRVDYKIIKDVTVAVAPDINVYRVGEEISIEGLVLYITFQNAESEYFAYNSQYNGIFEYEIQYAKEGQTSVKLILNYMGNTSRTINIPITVNPLMAISLINSGVPVAEAYAKDEENFIDLRNLMIVAVYNDEFTEELVLWEEQTDEGGVLAMASGATLVITKDSVDVTGILIVDGYKLALNVEGTYVMTVTYKGLKWTATFTVE